MSARDTNVHPLFPAEPGQLSPAEQRRHGLDQDQDVLSELSRHLSGLKRHFIEAVRDIDAISSRAGTAIGQAQVRAFMAQIEALEAGMNRLHGAMTTHQPR